jgi:hypothetical protein
VNLNIVSRQNRAAQHPERGELIEVEPSAVLHVAATPAHSLALGGTAGIPDAGS